MYTYLIQQVHQKKTKYIRQLLQEGVDPNLPDSWGKTALFYTDNIEILQLLLEHGADINHETFDGKHLLSELATAKPDNKEAIDFLLTQPSLNIDFKNKAGIPLVLSVCLRGHSAFFPANNLQAHIVKTLIKKGCKIDELYLWLKEKAYSTYKMVGYSSPYDLKKIAGLILSASACFLEESNLNFTLKKLFILSASILKNNEFLSQSLQLKSAEEDSFLREYKKALLNSENELLPYENGANDLSMVFTDIQNIFRNPAVCLRLLKELDNSLRLKCEQNGIDISASEQKNQAYFYSTPLVWAVPENLDKEYSFKTNNMLNNTLLEREEKWGINVDKKVYTFKGHVPSYLAKKLIKSKHLFVESFDSATHGTNIHRIQWDMVETARRLGMLNTRGFTSKQLLQASVDKDWWDNVFDNLANSLNANYFSDTGFSSPQTLYSSLLLLENELPFLSYFARKSLVQNLQKVQKLNPAHSHLSLYGLYTLTDGSFGLFKLNSFNPQTYYTNKHLTFFEGSRQIYAKQALSAIDDQLAKMTVNLTI